MKSVKSRLSKSIQSLPIELQELILEQTPFQFYLLPVNAKDFYIYNTILQKSLKYILGKGFEIPQKTMENKSFITIENNRYNKSEFLPMFIKELLRPKKSRKDGFNKQEYNVFLNYFGLQEKDIF